MISRRNYVSITILMVSVLLLCIGINNLKDNLNDYSVNRYTETAENYPSKINMYVPDGSNTAGSKDLAVWGGLEAAAVPRDLVVCIGGKDEMCMKAAEEWVAYTKRNIVSYPTLADYAAAEAAGELPEMLVLEPSCVDWDEDWTFGFLDKCLESRTSLVFCSLPDVSVIESSRQVRELLGIHSVRAKETTVEGFYLRGGFLLGGATFYLEKSAENEPMPGSSVFPGERTFPWYLPSSGTKVYMRGIPEDGTVDTEDYPIVMWRNSRGDGCVFAVNGDFMSGQAGIGLLSAMAAEMHAYELYPVVNAQNMVLTGFPCLADENAEEMERLYSRSVKRVNQELMWPSISQLLQKYNYKATCMMAPQYDYSDSSLPDGKLLEDYLKMFAEQSVETGLYGSSESATSLSEKLEADGKFFQNALGGYDVVSFYAGGLEDEQITQAFTADVLSAARTVVREYDGTGAGPVGFLSENITAQNVLSDGMNYTYQSDFLVRSMETALGYLSVSFDMSQVAYPDDSGTTWTQLSMGMASTVSTYGEQYPDFARTTAAECDARIRQFLAMDYSQSRAGSQIMVKTEGVSGPVWFILRTHNEAVLDMDGGSWTELEEGAYLIEVTGGDAVLTLGPADRRYFQ